jgi:hypothetical protein
MPRFIAFVRLTLRFAAWLLFISAISAHAQKATLLWSVDLAKDPDFEKRLSVSEVLLTPPAVAFLNDEQIICSFYDDERVGFDLSLTRNRFHVLEIDAHTGAFGRKLDFPSVDDKAKALPLADGSFVVLAGDKLQEFHKDFTLAFSYPTPIAGANQLPDSWLMDIAPGGGEIALYHHLGAEDRQDMTWLRSSDLAPVRTIAAEGGFFLTASNNAYIIDSMDQEPCTGCLAWYLTDDLLFVDRPTHFADHRAYAIQTLSGKRIASGPLEGGGADISRSMNSTRVAFLHGGGSQFSLTFQPPVAATVTVLDWTTKKRLVELELTQPATNPSVGFSQSALALSPEGKYLLVLLHHTLTCYKLSN